MLHGLASSASAITPAPEGAITSFARLLHGAQRTAPDETIYRGPRPPCHAPHGNVSNPRSLTDALVAYPLFFEPVPPPARTHAGRVADRIEGLVRLVGEVPRLDALVVPELVDENHEGKPHYRSGDIRPFASALKERTGREVIVNKVVAYLGSFAELEGWVTEAIAQGLRHVVFVGGASRYIPYPGPSVADANRVCRPLLASGGGRVGNIAIPQRTGEPHRMLSKTRVGASFFTTQIVFDASQTVEMVHQYDLLCRQAAIPPATVLVSFAPLADEQDIEFIRWLGADIPDSVEEELLAGEDSEIPRRSERRALDVWQRILHAVRTKGIEVPLGVNVEQVSARHLDVAGHLLKEFASRFADLPSATTRTGRSTETSGKALPTGSGPSAG